MAEKDKLSSISKSSTIEEMAEFWDTHDVTDFEDDTYEVEMEFDIQFRSHYPMCHNKMRQLHPWK
jgi:hypothetical protein